MPSRGQYWKKGGLVDETVKEEDLSQALQTKVNSGGGGGETLADITVGTPTDLVDLVFSTSVDLVNGDVGKIILCGYWDLATDIDSEGLIIRINGLTASDYNTMGWVVNLGTGSSTFQFGADHWISQNDIFGNTSMKVTILGRNDPLGAINGFWEYGSGQNVGNGGIQWVGATQTSITSIQVLKRQGATLGGTLATGSRFWVQTKPF